MSTLPTLRAICDEFGFKDVIISVKSTDVRLMIEAYRLVA